MFVLSLGNECGSVFSDSELKLIFESPLCVDVLLWRSLGVSLFSLSIDVIERLDLCDLLEGDF